MKSPLQRILDRGAGEREVVAWIKKYPYVLAHTFRSYAFPSLIVPEFPFGTDFRADFVALGPFSGGWSISFLELEPPTAPLFTQAGNPAKRLAGAISQVDSWRTFVEANRDTVIRDLSKFAKSKDMLRGPRKEEPIDNVGWPMWHPKSSLHFYYTIIIGRSSNMDDTQISRKGEYLKHHGIEIMTYNRLIEADTARARMA